MTRNYDNWCIIQSSIFIATPMPVVEIRAHEEKITPKLFVIFDQATLKRTPRFDTGRKLAVKIRKIK